MCPFENKNKEKNNNLILFDKTNEKINFDVSHLDKKNYDKIILKVPNEAFEYYYYILFDNDNNKFIIKKKIKTHYSNIHIGNNI
jgi:hypothetical protein